MRGVYRFFASIAMVIALFLVMAFIAVKVYDRNNYSLSTPASDMPATITSIADVPVDRNIDLTYHPSASLASEKKPAQDPVLKNSLNNTESSQVNMEKIFADFRLSHPVTDSHMEKLRNLLLAKKFLYDEVDLWIENALPEVSGREAEMIYVRIVKLRQKAMQK